MKENFKQDGLKDIFIVYYCQQSNGQSEPV